MLTLLRNLCIIAGILFLLVGGMLHHLRQEESMAYWLLLQHVETSKPQHKYDTDILITYPSGTSLLWQHNPEFTYNPLTSINLKHKMQKILLSRYDLGLVTIDILTHKQNLVLPSYAFTHIIELSNPNELLVIIHNPELSEISEFQLYLIDINDFSITFIDLLNPSTRTPNIQIDKSGMIAYEVYGGFWYKSYPDRTHKHLANRLEITSKRSFDEREIFYSYDRSSYIYFNPAFNAWIVFNMQSQIINFIESPRGSYQTSQFLGWTENNWLIMEFSTQTLTGKSAIYYRIRPDNKQREQLLSSTNHPEATLVEDIYGKRWIYLVRETIPPYERTILSRISLENGDLKDLIEDFSLLYHDYKNEYLVWGEYSSNSYVIYEGFPDNRRKLFDISQISQQSIAPNYEEIMQINKDTLVYNYCYNVTLPLPMCGSVLIDLQQDNFVTKLDGIYITHSPPIDRPYQSELPFLLSAWCGFMALLLGTLPKVLYKEETLHLVEE